MKSLGGFMRRVSDDLYVVILERKGLDKAIACLLYTSRCV